MKFRLPLAILIALFAILTLLDRFVLIELFARRIALPLLAAGLVAAAILATGTLFRRSSLVDLPLDYLIGFPLFGTICFLAATLTTSVFVLVPLVAVGAITGAILLWRSRAALFDIALPPAHWSLIAVAAVLACGFVAAQAPPSSLDELAYHLAVPHAWVLEGRAIELPLLSHAYFPLGIESASLPLFATIGPLNGGIASHILHLLAAITTTVLIARRAQHWLLTTAIITTPALAVTAGWSLVDWPLVGLFVALYVAMESDDRITASAVTAAGLLTKYTFAPFALIAWALKRRRPAWTVIIGAVFFVRNLILTGNPFAPFFAGDAPHVSGFRSPALADYIFEGVFVDEALGVALLALPAFATGSIAVGALVLAAALFFLGPSSRILVPFLVVPSLGASAFLSRRWLRGVIGVGVVLQTFLVLWLTARGGTFSLLAGTMSDEEYLRSQRATHQTVEWVNRSLPPRSRLMVIGMGETYWFVQPARGGGNSDGPRVSRYLEMPAPEALRERMRRDGITHVAVISVPVPTAHERKRAERRTELTPGAQKMLAQMLDRHAITVASHENATLFTLD